MSMVGFPLLLIPLAIYNMIVFLMPGVGFSEMLFRIQLVSGEIWAISLGDILLALSILLLLLEVIKAARPAGKYLTDHLLSLLLFGAAAAEFVMWPKFANSIFFLLTLLAMVEFFAGVALRTKRRARAIAAAPIVSEPHAEEPPSHEPEVLPPEQAIHAPDQGPPELPSSPAAVAPAAVPAAASVAESVLMDHAAPEPVQPAGAHGEPASSQPPSEPAVSEAPASEIHQEPATRVAAEPVPVNEPETQAHEAGKSGTPKSE
jgi:hypothetical protein